MNNRNLRSEKSKEAIFEDLKTHPQNYTCLELNNMGINTTDIKILASIIRSNPTLATSLKELGLRDNKIDNEGVNILAELFHSAENNITLLDIKNNCVDSIGIRSFAEQYTKTCKHKENLQLFINNGNENDYAEIIKKCPNITEIYITESLKINWSNKNFLLSFAQNKTLISLDVGGLNFNKRDPVMKRELAELFDGLIKNKKLKNLLMDNCDIRDAAAPHIAQLLIESSIEKISLVSNLLTSQSAFSLANAIRESKTIKILDLNENYFDEEGIEILTLAAKEKQITISLDSQHKSRKPPPLPLSIKPVEKTEKPISAAEVKEIPTLDMHLNDFFSLTKIEFTLVRKDKLVILTFSGHANEITNLIKLLKKAKFNSKQLSLQQEKGKTTVVFMDSEASFTNFFIHQKKFMQLFNEYKKSLYNQTASKSEQIQKETNNQNVREETFFLCNLDENEQAEWQQNLHKAFCRAKEIHIEWKAAEKCFYITLSEQNIFTILLPKREHAHPLEFIISSQKLKVDLFNLFKKAFNENKEGTIESADSYFKIYPKESKTTIHELNRQVFAYLKANASPTTPINLFSHAEVREVSAQKEQPETLSNLSNDIATNQMEVTPENIKHLFSEFTHKENPFDFLNLLKSTENKFVFTFSKKGVQRIGQIETDIFFRSLVTTLNPTNTDFIKYNNYNDKPIITIYLAKLKDLNFFYDPKTKELKEELREAFENHIETETNQQSADNFILVANDPIRTNDKPDTQVKKTPDISEKKYSVTNFINCIDKFDNEIKDNIRFHLQKLNQIDILFTSDKYNETQKQILYFAYLIHAFRILETTIRYSNYFTKLLNELRNNIRHYYYDFQSHLKLIKPLMEAIQALYSGIKFNASTNATKSITIYLPLAIDKFKNAIDTLKNYENNETTLNQVQYDDVLDENILKEIINAKFEPEDLHYDAILMLCTMLAESNTRSKFRDLYRKFHEDLKTPYEIFRNRLYEVYKPLFADLLNTPGDYLIKFIQ